MTDPGGDLLDVTIIRRAAEADGIISLELAASDGQPLPRFEAGAHIDVHVADGVVRQYSLCSDPADVLGYRLAILLEASSRGGSANIHAQFQPGQTIRIGAPRNAFRLVEDARRSILVAGGIGVTPLYAMAHRLQAIGADFDFHYCTRSGARTAFREELRRASFAERLTVHIDDEGDALEPDVAFAQPEPGTHLYICGPAGFIDYISAAAARLGWAKANVHVEHFGAEIDSTGDSFTVEARRSGLTLTIPGDKTIAQILLANGVDVPLSCEQGVCGTCVTRVLEGKPDHRDMFLSEDEQEAGEEMAICCSRSKTPMLVLDI